MKEIGNKIIYLESVDSTNNYLKIKSLDNKPKEGLLVFANEQVSGRGQRENSWESKAGKNLLLSFIVYPTFLKANKQFILSKTISLAIADCISQYTDNVRIKWPNDIYIGNQKIAGVLIENTIKGSEISSSIIGIGININQKKFSNKIPNPVSLTMLTKKEYNINELLGSLIELINTWYNKLLVGDTKEIDNEYINRLFRFNQVHNYIAEGATIEAKITGINQDGKLMVKTKNGDLKTFAFKEIKYCIGNVGELP
ncbi:MAG: biotin--[acetyl-CoA-carboxylase] ligase [Bacteroidota bacterium]